MHIKGAALTFVPYLKETVVKMNFFHWCWYCCSCVGDNLWDMQYFVFEKGEKDSLQAMNLFAKLSILEINSKHIKPCLCYLVCSWKKGIVRLICICMSLEKYDSLTLIFKHPFTYASWVHLFLWASYHTHI